MSDRPTLEVIGPVTDRTSRTGKNGGEGQGGVSETTMQRPTLQETISRQTISRQTISQTISQAAGPASSQAPAQAATGAAGVWGQPALLYETTYVWFVFVSALDVMFTWIILHSGGQELNWIAAVVISHSGLYGMLGFKFSLVTLIVLICEEIGRRKHTTGLAVAEWAVMLTTIPVVVAVVQLLSVNPAQ